MRLETPVEFADQSLTRASGASRVPGNRVRLLKNAAENYPAWIEAIESAEKWIHFETYIIHEDEAGRHFADLLSTKAREGVKVRLIYDWVGSLRNASGKFAEAGSGWSGRSQLQSPEPEQSFRLG